MVNMTRRTAVVLAVAVLAALAKIAAARGVPAFTYAIQTDRNEAVIDVAGQYVVETESDTDFEDLRGKRREYQKFAIDSQ